MPTVDEQNAAFDAVHKEAVAEIPELPWMAQNAVRQELGTENGRKLLLKFVGLALGAAEKVRAKQK